MPIDWLRGARANYQVAQRALILNRCQDTKSSDDTFAHMSKTATTLRTLASGVNLIEKGKEIDISTGTRDLVNLNRLQLFVVYKERVKYSFCVGNGE